MITLKSLRNLSITVQLCSLALTALVFFLHLGLQIEPDSVQSMGGSFSLALVFSAVIAHMQAKQGKPHPGLLTFLCAFGPGYMLIGGTLRHVAGFHLVSIAAHAVVYMAVRSRLKSESGPQTPS